MMSPYSNPDTSFSMLLFTSSGFDDCELVEVVTPVSVDSFLSDIVKKVMPSTAYSMEFKRDFLQLAKIARKSETVQKKESRRPLISSSKYI